MHLPGMSRVLLAAWCKHAAQVAVLHQHTLAISDYNGRWLEAVWCYAKPFVNMSVG